MAYEIFAQDTLTTTATSIDLTSIPATHTHLELLFNARSTKVSATTTRGEMLLNGESGSYYGTTQVYVFNGGSPTGYNQPVDTRTVMDMPFNVMNDSMPSNTYAPTRMLIPNYASTSISRKGVLSQLTSASSDTPTTYWQSVGHWSFTTGLAISQITLYAESVSYPFKAGTSYSLAGWE